MINPQPPYRQVEPVAEPEQSIPYRQCCALAPGTWMQTYVPVCFKPAGHSGEHAARGEWLPWLQAFSWTRVWSGGVS